MQKSSRMRRFFEIMPGVISWSIIVFFIILAFIRPILCAILVIVFDFYWIIRTGYLTTLLLLAYRKLHKQRGRNWPEECKEFYQLVIFPVYKEGIDILRNSLLALRASDYPHQRIVLVVAHEERNPKSRELAKQLEAEFGNEFFAYISTFHPDNIPGETRTKGANATWAAREAKKFINLKNIRDEQVIVSCFDADTCVDTAYFSCLAYHFLTTKNPHQASYQPIPVYNNNIWQAPSFARIVEIGASFCQMIESMRLEKFVTFSSHSMSFKSLVDIGYWPVDMVSDDSVIYWKAFLHYNGDYHVIPLYITVSMDVAYSRSLFKTIIMQYKQKRRWAWGVENFPFLAMGFIENNKISLYKKIRRSFHLLESHVTWATWAILLIFIGPLPLIVGGALFNQLAISYNLPKITGLLFNFTLGTSLAMIILSRTILPPRPKGVSWTKNIVMTLEWVIVPFIIVILGSLPALDAQTRLMLGKYMEFNPTEKSKIML